METRKKTDPFFEDFNPTSIRFWLEKNQNLRLIDVGAMIAMGEDCKEDPTRWSIIKWKVKKVQNQGDDFIRVTLSCAQERRMNVNVTLKKDQTLIWYVLPERYHNALPIPAFLAKEQYQNLSSTYQEEPEYSPPSSVRLASSDDLGLRQQVTAYMRTLLGKVNKIPDLSLVEKEYMSKQLGDMIAKVFDSAIIASEKKEDGSLTVDEALELIETCKEKLKEGSNLFRNKLSGFSSTISQASFNHLHDLNNGIQVEGQNVLQMTKDFVMSRIELSPEFDDKEKFGGSNMDLDLSIGEKAVPRTPDIDVEFGSLDKAVADISIGEHVEELSESLKSKANEIALLKEELKKQEQVRKDQFDELLLKMNGIIEAKASQLERQKTNEIANLQEIYDRKISSARDEFLEEISKQASLREKALDFLAKNKDEERKKQQEIMKAEFEFRYSKLEKEMQSKLEAQSKEHEEKLKRASEDYSKKVEEQSIYVGKMKDQLEENKRKESKAELNRDIERKRLQAEYEDYKRQLEEEIKKTKHVTDRKESLEDLFKRFSKLKGGETDDEPSDGSSKSSSVKGISSWASSSSDESIPEKKKKRKKKKSRTDEKNEETLFRAISTVDSVLFLIGKVLPDAPVSELDGRQQKMLSESTFRPGNIEKIVSRYVHDLTGIKYTLNKFTRLDYSSSSLNTLRLGIKKFDEIVKDLLEYDKLFQEQRIEESGLCKVRAEDLEKYVTIFEDKTSYTVYKFENEVKPLLLESGVQKSMRGNHILSLCSTSIAKKVRSELKEQKNPDEGQVWTVLKRLFGLVGFLYERIKDDHLSLGQLPSIMDRARSGSVPKKYIELGTSHLSLLDSALHLLEVTHVGAETLYSFNYTKLLIKCLPYEYSREFNVDPSLNIFDGDDNSRSKFKGVFDKVYNSYKIYIKEAQNSLNFNIGGEAHKATKAMALMGESPTPAKGDTGSKVPNSFKQAGPAWIRDPPNSGLQCSVRLKYEVTNKLSSSIIIHRFKAEDPNCIVPIPEGAFPMHRIVAGVCTVCLADNTAKPHIVRFLFKQRTNSVTGSLIHEMCPSLASLSSVSEKLNFLNKRGVCPVCFKPTSDCKAGPGGCKMLKEVKVLEFLKCKEESCFQRASLCASHFDKNQDWHANMKRIGDSIDMVYCFFSSIGSRATKEHPTNVYKDLKELKNHYSPDKIDESYLDRTSIYMLLKMKGENGNTANLLLDSGCNQSIMSSRLLGSGFFPNCGTGGNLNLVKGLGGKLESTERIAGLPLKNGNCRLIKVQCVNDLSIQVKRIDSQGILKAIQMEDESNVLKGVQVYDWMLIDDKLEDHLNVEILLGVEHIDLFDRIFLSHLGIGIYSTHIDTGFNHQHLLGGSINSFFHHSSKIFQFLADQSVEGELSSDDCEADEVRTHVLLCTLQDDVMVNNSTGMVICNTSETNRIMAIQHDRDTADNNYSNYAGNHFSEDYVIDSDFEEEWDGEDFFVYTCIVDDIFSKYGSFWFADDKDNDGWSTILYEGNHEVSVPSNIIYDSCSADTSDDEDPSQDLMCLVATTGQGSNSNIGSNHSSFNHITDVPISQGHVTNLKYNSDKNETDISLSYCKPSTTPKSTWETRRLAELKEEASQINRNWLKNKAPEIPRISLLVEYPDVKYSVQLEPEFWPRDMLLRLVHRRLEWAKDNTNGAAQVTGEELKKKQAMELASLYSLDTDSLVTKFVCLHGSSQSTSSLQGKIIIPSPNEPPDLGILLRLLEGEIPDNNMALQQCQECVLRNNNKSLKLQIEDGIIDGCILIDPQEHKILITLPLCSNASKLLLASNEAESREVVAKLLGRIKPNDRDLVKRAFSKMCERGAVIKLRDLPREIQEKINNSEIRHFLIPGIVFKPDSASSPCRIVVNASRRARGAKASLNQCLLRGSSKSKLLLTRLARNHRMWQVGYCGDLLSFYNSFPLCPSQYSLQLWHWAVNLNPEEIETFVYTNLTFGVTPSSYCTEFVMNKLVLLHPNELQDFLYGRYVDDVAGGGSTVDEVKERCKVGCDLLSQYNLKFKEIHISRVESEITKNAIVKIAGGLWDVAQDKIRAECPLIFKGKKERGRVTSFDILQSSSSTQQEYINFLTEGQMTITEFLSHAASFYTCSTIGALLLPNIRILVSSVMKTYNPNKSKDGWKTQVGVEFRYKLALALFELTQHSLQWFPRCSIPFQAKLKDPSEGHLWMFCDSLMVDTSLAYCLHQDSEEEFSHINFVDGRTRITNPGLSLFKRELSAMDLCREHCLQIVNDIGHSIKRKILLSDSMANIQNIKNIGKSHDIFTNKKYSLLREVFGEDIYFCPSSLNLADCSTRPFITHDKVGPSSDVFLGLPFMRKGISKAEEDGDVIKISNLPGKNMIINEHEAKSCDLPMLKLSENKFVCLFSNQDNSDFCLSRISRSRYEEIPRDSLCLTGLVASASLLVDIEKVGFGSAIKIMAVVILFCKKLQKKPLPNNFPPFELMKIRVLEKNPKQTEIGKRLIQEFESSGNIFCLGYTNLPGYEFCFRNLTFLESLNNKDVSSKTFMQTNVAKHSQILSQVLSLLECWEGSKYMCVFQYFCLKFAALFNSLLNILSMSQDSEAVPFITASNVNTLSKCVKIDTQLYMYIINTCYFHCFSNAKQLLAAEKCSLLYFIQAYQDELRNARLKRWVQIHGETYTYLGKQYLVSRSKLAALNQSMLDSETKNCYNIKMEIPDLLLLFHKGQSFSRALLLFCHLSRGRELQIQINQSSGLVQTHFGEKSTFNNLSSYCHIPGIMELSRRLVSKCPPCRIRVKKFIQKKHGPYSVEQLGFVQVFYCVQFDSLTPLRLKIHAQGRNLRGKPAFKDYCLHVFVCIVSGFVFTVVGDDMSLNSITLAFTRLSSLFGTPHIVHIDRHSSNMSFVKHAELLNSVNIQLLKQQGFCFEIARPGSHYQNPMVERKIGMLQTWINSDALQRTSLSQGEADTLFLNACSLMNNTPLYWAKQSNILIKPQSFFTPSNSHKALIGPITPDNIGEGAVQRIVEGFDAVLEIYRTFYIPNTLRPQKWLQEGELQATVGTLCYVKTKAGGFLPGFHLGLIKEIELGKDGKISGVLVRYIFSEVATMKKNLKDLLSPKPLDHIRTAHVGIRDVVPLCERGDPCIQEVLQNTCGFLNEILMKGGAKFDASGSLCQVQD